MFKKLVILALVGGMLYLVFVHPPTSRVIFSRKPVLVKILEVAEYLVVSGLKLVWQAALLIGRLLQFLGRIALDAWTRYTGGNTPTFDIRSHRELYALRGNGVRAESGVNPGSDGAAGRPKTLFPANVPRT